jgi:phenylpropionate dioxygenase-like ring-hydroxylating dioxygenase large terminal subunit
VDLLGEPILIVRDESQRLRAFSRVCLHRAFPIAQGSGHAKRLVCPYHRWSYDLDGRLAAAPFMDQVPGFDRDACRLPELRLSEWQGFALVTLSPDTPPLGAELAPLDELLDPFHLTDAVAIEPLSFESPFNWKVLVENFMESYHHMGPHLETLQPTNPAKGTHALDLKGPFAVLENPASPGNEPFWVFQVFPTLLFAQTRGGLPLTTWYELRIDSADHFGLRILPLLPREFAKNPDVVRLVRETLDQIHREDIPMCEGVQRGLASGLWTPGPQSRQERCLWLFHRWLAEQMLGGAPS